MTKYPYCVIIYSMNINVSNKTTKNKAKIGASGKSRGAIKALAAAFSALLALTFVFDTKIAEAVTYNYSCNSSGCYLVDSNGNPINTGNNGNNGNGNPSGNQGNQGNQQSGSNYPYQIYKYFQNPSPSSSTGSGSNNSYYVPQTYNYDPEPYQIFVPYKKQADGSLKLDSAKIPPAYAFNADNTVSGATLGNSATRYTNPTSSYGNSYGNTYNPYASGHNGQGGFRLTSSGN